PLVLSEVAARRMEGNRLPAALHQAAMAEHLEILRRRFRWRPRVLEAHRETRALDGHLRHAIDRSGRRHTHEIEQGRREIAGMAELMPQLTACWQALGPGDHQGIADATAMRVLLVAAQR